ncbi:hypothetical protein DsansV1_C08g0086781 [Dioscorea sansibarensis]
MFALFVTSFYFPLALVSHAIYLGCLPWCPFLTVICEIFMYCIACLLLEFCYHLLPEIFNLVGYRL